MSKYEETRETILKNIIISKLFESKAILEGDFILKSGLKTNLYFDLRILISYPNIYKYLLELAELKYPDLFNSINIISGIEYGGLPFSNYISFNKNIPQIFIRSSVKNYGTKKIYEGKYNNENILLVDDVITTGNSINSIINTIKHNKLKLSKILVILDRSDRFENLDNFEYHSILTINDINDYIQNNNINNNIYFNNKISNNIYRLSLNKKSNIILSCDLTDWNDIINLINKTGKYIIGIKLHIEIVKNFTKDTINNILELKNKYNLIIIEDRKFSDIGMISIKELSGFFDIASWADCVTVHTICGLELFENINSIYPHLGLLPVCEMSIKSSFMDDGYINNSINILKNKEYNIVGGIVQDRVLNKINSFDTITLSPGIKFNDKGDNYNQTYSNPLNNDKKLGLFWIIGRGIYESNDIIETINKYRTYGWEHFINY